jgi:UDP-3-O-[3-hydroxymyristoyl] N-acetylglucosamine deacetylase/3-hydroxyacyl-[acyl-carrier-protein] dehydratase
MLTARRLQRTIARETEIQGVGFIFGTDVSMRFRPAGADSGVVFVRIDLPERPAVRAHITNVIPRQRRTTLQQGAASVEMVEHVMAALAGLRIDNCTIEIDAPETPGCDGSSRAFVEALSQAGTVELDRPRETLVIDRPVAVHEGGAVLAAHPGPGEGLVLSYNLDYGPSSPIGSQSFFVDVSPETFRGELATSRTFLLEAEAQALRAAGIGARTRPSDLLIFGPEGVIDNTLRYPDECARHKILDMVGDLALLDKDLSGHVVAHRSGHQLNAVLVRKLIESAGSEHSARGSSVACTGPGSSLSARSGNSNSNSNSSVSASESAMEIGTILKILPHRFPFLLVDRVLAHEPARRVRALKNVTYNEPFFQGHWPQHPIMPGVLILEALAQTAGIMIAGIIDSRVRSALIVAIDGVKIRRPVIPGDQLLLEVDGLRVKQNIAEVEGVAYVGEHVAAEARIRFMIVDNPQSD